MPRRKQRKTISKNAKSANATPFVQKHSRFAEFRWGESYTSLLLGIVVVIIAVLFGVSIIRQTNHVKDITALQTGPTNTSATQSPTPTQPVEFIKNGRKVYIVQKGDNLWTIAEKFYKSGYNWVDIAKANDLTNPSAIFSGNQLVVPDVAPKAITVDVHETVEAANAIHGTTYTVQKNDDLWTIAVRAYGDGYKWTDIANANNLTNPNVIFSGNTLQIPR